MIIPDVGFHFRRWRALRAAERLLPPPTVVEREEIDALHRAFRALPIAPLRGVPVNEADWNSAMNRLRELGSSADPRAFLRWDVIIARMAHVGSAATAVELAALQADPEWTSRWRDAIREVRVGLPIPYEGYPASSEVLIQTAYHVRELERLSVRRVDEWDVVVEFGGGFGGLCRLMHVLGFRGRYLILDLAPFSILQRYYLDAVQVVNRDNITITSDWNTLDHFVDGISPSERAVLWATWSLSETPLALRTRVAAVARRIGNYCIAFQGRYGDVDNVAYFRDEWPGDQRTTERIGHRDDDYYLSGRIESRSTS